LKDCRRFYHPDLKPNQWFTYYATKFKTVEINSTFYNFPKKSSIKRFYKISPEDFKFSVKVNKAITHIKRFKDQLKIQEQEKIGFYREYHNFSLFLLCLLCRYTFNNRF
jgi:uncharacterized protein YecE (DUF72 family)